jgi:hypothetical protein
MYIIHSSNHKDSAKEKGHFLDFLKTWGGLGPLAPPPGSYAPDAKSSNIRPFTDFILRF